MMAPKNRQRTISNLSNPRTTPPTAKVISTRQLAHHDVLDEKFGTSKKLISEEKIALSLPEIVYTNAQRAVSFDVQQQAEQMLRQMEENLNIQAIYRERVSDNSLLTPVEKEYIRQELIAKAQFLYPKLISRYVQQRTAKAVQQIEVNSDIGALYREIVSDIPILTSFEQTYIWKQLVTTIQSILEKIQQRWADVEKHLRELDLLDRQRRLQNDLAAQHRALRLVKDSLALLQNQLPNGNYRRRMMEALGVKLSPATEQLSLNQLDDIDWYAWYLARAQPIIKTSSVREQLCRVLKQLIGTDKIDKDTLPVLIQLLILLAIAGTISIPLTPALIAGLAWLVALEGIESLCPEPYEQHQAEEQR
jgi:hypothetical protein